MKGRADDEWHPGALGHSLHALAIYEQHVLDSQPGDRSERLAQNAAAASR